MEKINCVDIEVAVANMFNIRQNIIVPNVSWGAGLHECDLLILRKSGHAIEVEIKISKQDLKKDFLKSHGHRSDRIKELYYAVPEFLKEVALELVPVTAGVIVCQKWSWNNEGVEWYTSAKIEREPDAPKHITYQKWDKVEINNVARLGCLRIWNLKRSLNKYKREVQKLKKEIAGMSRK